MLSADELAWGNLSQYNVIVTGVRAYERRADLRASNHRLIEYAEAGGTVIVQYNKFEFNEAQYGPYPAKVSSNRVTGRERPGPGARPEPSGVQRPQPDRRDHLEGMGAGARPLLPRPRQGQAICGPRAARGSVSPQPGGEDGRARGGGSRQGPLDLRGTRAVAAASGRDGRARTSCSRTCCRSPRAVDGSQFTVDGQIIRDGASA